MTRSYRDFITSTLRKNEECHIRTNCLDISTANRFVKAHGIDFFIVKALDSQGVLRDYYRFWIDTQQRFRHKLLERQKWQRWGRVVGFAILAYVVCLGALVLIPVLFGGR